MISSNRYLALCQKLHEAESSVTFEEGDRLARGFADLGYEEFLLLPAKKLVSLYTGAMSELREDQLSHFFRVYGPDEMVALIQRREFDVDSLIFVEQRRWRLNLRAKEGSTHEFIAATLTDVLISGLFYVLTQRPLTIV